MYFGLRYIKFFALLCTFVNTVQALIFIICGLVIRTKWTESKGIEGQFLQLPFDYACFFGFILLAISFFGYFAIALDSYGMLVVYDILQLAAAIILLTVGISIWRECGYTLEEKPTTQTRLKMMMHDMSPAGLTSIQQSFQCCGIEKYTDYLVLWYIWARKYMSLDRLTRDRAPPINVTSNTSKKKRKSSLVNNTDTIKLTTRKPLEIPIQYQREQPSERGRGRKQIPTTPNWMDANWPNVKDTLKKYMVRDLDIEDNHFNKAVPELIKDWSRFLNTL